MADPFFAAVRDVVMRVLAESTLVDFRALYPARVEAWKEGGEGGAGTVDVAFEDALRRVVSKNDVPLLPGAVGLSYKPKKGALVLVGWRDGDERYPFAVGWAGGSGADEVGVVADLVKLGSLVSGDLDKAVTRGELQAILDRLVATWDSHVHAAGTLVAGMTTVSGATAPVTAISGTTTLVGSPNVRIKKGA